MRGLLFTCVLCLALPAAAQDVDRALDMITGDGALRDYGTAAEILREAADAGDARAQNALGKLTADGLGLAANPVAAERLLRAAAGDGSPTHLRDLALFLERDSATQPEARALYLQAAEAGDLEAMVSLGVMAQEGRGGAQDLPLAQAMYETAATEGHFRALNNLGLMYARGQGVAQDYERAAALFEQAIEAGAREALTNLGVLYENGHGVPVDEDYAAELFRAAGENSAGATPQVLGDPRITGPISGSGDLIDRFLIALTVASMDDPPTGDALRAAGAFRELARAGHTRSMYNLGLLHLRGENAAQDYALGLSWLLQAEARGDEAAEIAVQFYIPRLSADQLGEAADLARNRE